MHKDAAAVRPTADPVLKRFRAALDELYGDQLERVVLYGSRARGDHRPDSDYDVAVFIRGYSTLIEELRRLASIATEILLDTDVDISAIPFPAGAYRERTGFMHELRLDGIDISSPKPLIISKRRAAAYRMRRRLPRPKSMTLRRARLISLPITPPKRTFLSILAERQRRIGVSGVNSADWPNRSRVSPGSSRIFFA
jgi:predicted nucleotidyltransferase